MTNKARNIVSILAVLIIIYGVAANWYGLWPFDASRQETVDSRQHEENEVCAQVITFAVNPETG
jgi:hypothetical protein